MKYFIASLVCILALRVEAREIVVSVETVKTVVDQETCIYPTDNENLKTLYEKALESCELSHVTGMSDYSAVNQKCDISFGGWTGQIHRIATTVSSAKFNCEGVSRIVVAKGFVDTNGSQMSENDERKLYSSIKENSYSQCCQVFGDCKRVQNRGVKILSQSYPAPDTRRVGHACGGFPTEGCGEYYKEKGFSSIGQVKCL